METGAHCAYNATRGALLSDRVTFADSSLTALQILGRLMEGPGADKRSAVSVDSACIGRIPRFFAFDVLYLDETLRVLAVSSVDANADFPPMPVEVKTALILPDGRIDSTFISPGDEIRFCEAAELPVLVELAPLPATSPTDAREIPASEPQTYIAAPVHTVSFEVIRPSEFVFEPFLNSLIYSPPLASSNAHLNEFFLPQRTAPAAEAHSAEESSATEEAGIPDQSVAKEQNVPAEATAEAEPSPEAPVAGPVVSFASPKELSKALDAFKSPRRIPLKKKGEKPPPKEADPATSQQPKPIRFFDPLNAAASGNDEAVQEPPPARASNYLSPELKAAILQIDEQRRRQQLAAQTDTREKSTRGKKNIPEPSPVPPVEEPAISAASSMAIPEIDKGPVSAPSVPAAEHRAPTPEPPRVLAVPATPLDVPRPADAHAVAHTPAPEGSAAQPTPPQAVHEPILSEPLPATSNLVLGPEIEFAPTVPVAGEESLIASAGPMPESELAAPPAERGADVVAPESVRKAAAKPTPAPVQPHKKPAPARRSATPKAGRAALRPPEPAKTEASKAKLSMGERFSRWLEGTPIVLDGQRRAKRHEVPGLVAFYWSGGTPRPHEIVNISKTGFYLRTKDLWSPNTLVRMTLQRNIPDSDTQESLSILARVVRIDEEGVGHEFVSNEALMALHTRDLLPEHGTDIKALGSFLNLA